jgi:hypothetical protein|nr:MAG TPA: hypothetical protein [Caudoviricetes sp.]
MALRSAAVICVATAKHSENSIETFGAVYSKGKGYEVNCCAVALRSTDRQGKGKAKSSGAMAWYCAEGMAEQRNGREKR